MNSSINYFIEYMRYFFISLNITPKNINNKITTIVNTKQILSNISDNNVIEKISLYISNYISNTKLMQKYSANIPETEMKTFSSNFNDDDEIEIIYIDTNTNLDQDTILVPDTILDPDPDDIIQLYIFLLDDKSYTNNK